MILPTLLNKINNLPFPRENFGTNADAQKEQNEFF